MFPQPQQQGQPQGMMFPQLQQQGQSQQIYNGMQPNLIGQMMQQQQQPMMMPQQNMMMPQQTMILPPPTMMMPQQSMMGTQQSFMGQGPQMMHQTPQNSDQHINQCAADSAGQGSYDKSPHASITTAATSLWQLPVSRIQDLFEDIDADTYDAVLTSSLSHAGLWQLFFILTGTRPDTQVKGCRAKTYGEFTAKMLKAHKRRTDELARAKMLDINNLSMEEIRHKLSTLNNEQVQKIATTMCYDDSWHQKKAKKGGSSAPTLGQLTLPALAAPSNVVMDERVENDAGVRLRRMEWTIVASPFLATAAPTLPVEHALQPQNLAPSPPPEFVETHQPQQLAAVQTQQQLAAVQTQQQLAAAQTQQQLAAVQTQQQLAAVQTQQLAAVQTQLAAVQTQQPGPSLQLAAVQTQQQQDQQQRQDHEGHASQAAAATNDVQAMIRNKRKAALAKRTAAKARLAPVQQEGLGADAEEEEPPAAAIAEAEEASTPADTLICALCRDVLLAEGKHTQALPCMHNFHSECLADYMDVSGKPLEACCPMKCYLSSATSVSAAFASNGSGDENSGPGQELSDEVSHLAAHQQTLAQSMVHGVQ